MENLYDEGYEADQINQILKIEKLGYDITKYTSPVTSISTLRDLRNILISSNYTKKQTDLICKYFISSKIDIRPYIDSGFTLACQIHLVVELAQNGFNIDSIANKGYNYSELKLICKYFKKGTDITKYMQVGRREKEIKLCLAFDEFSLDYDEIRRKFKDSKLDAIENGILMGYNPVPYITNKHTSYQIDNIVNALSRGVDVNKISKLDTSPNVMSVAISGLEEGYDITPYITNKTCAPQAKLILKCLKGGIDPNKIKVYEDSKISSLAYDLLSNGISTEILDESKFDYEHLKFLTQIAIKKESCKSIDIDLLCRNDLPVEQLKVAVTAMQKELNPNALLKIPLEACDYRIVYEALLDGIDLSDYIYKGMDFRELASLMNLLSLGYKIIKPTE